MVFKTTAPGARRKTVAAAFALLLSASALTAPAAQAAEPDGGEPAGAPAAGAMDWRPTLTPFDSGQERVRRNLTGAQRNAILNNCLPGYACVAAGEGDGQHTVYELYFCTQRQLSNFINAGAVYNNQGGGPQIVLRHKDGSHYLTIYRMFEIVGVKWGPAWFLDPC